MIRGVRTSVANGPRDWALAGIVGVAGSYAPAGWSTVFVVAPIDAVIVRLTPGWLGAWFIVNVGTPAHLLHVALALAIAIGGLAGTAFLGLAMAKRTGRLLGVEDHPERNTLTVQAAPRGLSSKLCSDRVRILRYLQ